MAGRKTGQGSKWIRPAKRERIYQSDGHRCQFCGRSIYDHADLVLTLDHVQPCELGGENAATNLVTACLSCNSRKRDLPLAVFIQVLADEGRIPADIKRDVHNAQRRHARFERRGRKS